MKCERNRISLYSLFALFFLSLFLARSGQAQNFGRGLQNYQQKNYEQAASIFNGIKSPEAYLFAAKSQYALGRYHQAQVSLNNIPANIPQRLYDENLYTSALIDFQLKQFGDALGKLYQVNKEDKTPLAQRSKPLYQDILQYLTADQRIKAMKRISADEVKFDLLRTAAGKINYDDARDLVSAFDDAVKDRSWRKKAKRISSELSDKSNYESTDPKVPDKLKPPKGTIYNIGLALPRYQPDDKEFVVVRSLYFGAVLAADQYNSQHSNSKAYIRFVNTTSSKNALSTVVKEFSDTWRGDAIIGPLYSEQAKPMISLANKYRIPTIAPLANSVLDVKDSFLFQANATFAMHGKRMADYAVKSLNMHKFAVIAGQNSNGAISARAFKDEAEKLGAKIVYYDVTNLSTDDYDISRYTRQFGSKSDQIDAVYAPFAGKSAKTLIDHLLVDIKTMNAPITILGSQEWKTLNYNSGKYRGLNIYFSDGYYLPEREGSNIRRFKNDFQRKFRFQANQFSMMGYDIATFLLKTLDRVGNPALLKKALAKEPLYHGLVKNVQFDDGNVNQAVRILQVSSSGNVIVKH